MDDLAARVRELEAGRDRFLNALQNLSERLNRTRDRSRLVADTLAVTAEFLQCSSAIFYTQVAVTGRLRAIECVGKPPASDELGPDEGVPGADLVVAVRSGLHPFGVLAYFGLDTPRPFDEDDRTALLVLVRQAEVAIDTSFLHEEMTRLSLTDGLTGLWNRRQFDLRTASELSRAVRFSESFAVLFADIDCFKEVNDTYGHQAGDTVLVELARRLTEATREVDLVARYGGEEFTLLLPRTGVDGAALLADKIRRAVSESPFTLDVGDIALTVSVGVAAYPEHGSTVRELVGAADEALYRAKTAGRNRVVGAGQEH